MMESKVFYTRLKEKFEEFLFAHNAGNDHINVECRALSPDEAIGTPKRRDYPIITGKDIMIQAEYRGVRGQAFTEAPSAFRGTMKDVLALDIVNEPHSRSIFIAVVNAVVAYFGECKGTVHCRTEGPELCAGEMLAFLRGRYPAPMRIALIGYQPSLLAALSDSPYDVRVLDLNPANLGSVRSGILVEDGELDYDAVVNNWAELILCTGSTVTNGTITKFIDLPVEVLFFGTTLAGTAALLNLKRVCFADKYE